MVTYCTVCLNNTRKKKFLSFFNYPKDPIRRHDWLVAVGREDLLPKLENPKTRQQYRICEDHFERTFIKFSKNKTVKYLYDDAFPTLHLPSGGNIRKHGGGSARDDQEIQIEIQPFSEVPLSGNSGPINVR